MEPRKKKVLIGCLGGCGLVVLASIGSCVCFFVWLNSPDEVLEEPQRPLVDDTSAYLQWTLRLDDPGTLDFVHPLIDIRSRNAKRTDR